LLYNCITLRGTTYAHERSCRSPERSKSPYNPFLGIDNSQMSMSGRPQSMRRGRFKNRLLEYCRIFRAEQHSPIDSVLECQPLLPRLDTLFLQFTDIDYLTMTSQNCGFVNLRPKKLVLQSVHYCGACSRMILYPKWKGTLKEIVLLMDDSPQLARWELLKIFDIAQRSTIMSSVSTVTVVFNKPKSWEVSIHTGFYVMADWKFTDSTEIVSQLAFWIRKNRRTMRLVNTESLMSSWIGLPDTASSSTIAQTFETMIRAAIDLANATGSVDDTAKLQACVEFMSLTDYVKLRDSEGVFTDKERADILARGTEEGELSGTEE
jgi:hypothetical protein